MLFFKQTKKTVRVITILYDCNNNTISIVQAGICNIRCKGAISIKLHLRACVNVLHLLFLQSQLIQNWSGH